MANVKSEICDLTNFVTKTLDVEALADWQLVKLKRKKYRLRGRSSETAKAHRG
eukprot:TRINITY_DN958_c0_g3_i1.p4 TRINITY_DN958_c0_g3~~TRINITY_DN958_c0_g3_i1.p4  ORF type:complete len:53 (-),score=38.41 TRINITY_DN958_c0_g3_i1:2-160(-)